MTILNAEEIEQQKKEIREKVKKRIRKLPKCSVCFLVPTSLYKKFRSRAFHRDEKLSSIITRMMMNYIENS